MWIDTRDCVPLIDGEYLVQTVYGRVTSMNYTYEGGWNTHIDGNTGEVKCTENAFDNLYVVRWYRHTQPKAVPEAWYDEYREAIYREGV